MAKSADAFRTISEVADWLETPTHVLRFWESKFTQVKRVKRAGGRRYYRPADMELLGGIKKLLHDDGLTIKGVQKILREQGVKQVIALSPALDDSAKDASAETVSTVPAADISLDVKPDTETADVLPFSRQASEETPLKDEPAAVTAKQGEPLDVPPPSETAATGETRSDVAAAPTSDVTEDDKSDTGFQADGSQIPAFMHRTTSSASKTEATEKTVEVAKPKSVETPPDPSDEAFEVTSGILHKLFDQTGPLSPDAAARIAPLLDRLAAVHDKMRHTHKD